MTEEIKRVKILVRQGESNDLPRLSNGEPAITTDTNEFFIGTPQGNKQMASKADVDSVKSAVNGVKSTAQDAQEDAQSALNEVANMNSTISSIQGSVGTLQSDINSNQASINQHTEQISTLQQKQQDSDTTLQSVVTKATTTEGKVSTLESTVGTLNTTVQGKANSVDLQQTNQEVSQVKQGLQTTDTTITGLSQDIRNLKTKSSWLSIKDFGAKGDGTTSDQNAIQAAVDAALSSGRTLYWEEGTYVSTSSIANLHKVSHKGDGVIKRGTNLFYVEPKVNQRNVFYISGSGGSNLNDGLSTSQSITRLSVAMAYMDTYANPVAGGYWEFRLAAGTHDRRTYITPGLKTKNPIEIIGADVGGHPNVPTSIISEGSNAGAVGLYVEGGTEVIVKDVHFVGFRGTVSSGGITASDSSKVKTINCHFTDCYYGVSGVHHTATDVKGGIFTNCGYLAAGGGTGGAIRSLQLNNHSIGKQNAGDNTQGPFFINCQYGLYAQELSTGHADWCTFEGCNDAILIRVMGRVNCDGSLFKKNNRAIRLDGSSHTYISNNVQFGTGTDKNTYNVTIMSGSDVTSGRFFGGKEAGYSTSERIFDTRYVNQSYNASTNTKVYDLTLSAPLWSNKPSGVSPIKKITFRILGSMTGTTDSKRIICRLGSSNASLTFTASEQGTFTATGAIYFVEEAKQLISLEAGVHLNSSHRKALLTATNDMLTDTNLSLETYLFNTADSIKIELIEVGWAG